MSGTRAMACCHFGSSAAVPRPRLFVQCFLSGDARAHELFVEMKGANVLISEGFCARCVEPRFLRSRAGLVCSRRCRCPSSGLAFDLGKSDIKLFAVKDGEVLYSQGPGCPLKVNNDGEMTALAAFAKIGSGNILGISTEGQRTYLFTIG